MRTLHALTRRFHEETGEPLVSVAITDERSAPPDSEMRSEMVEQMRRTSEIVGAYYTVVMGSGFRATVIRSVLAGMYLAHRGPVRPVVARTIDDVLDREARRYTVPRSEILRQLRDARLIID